MPKDPARNVARYKIAGGKLNEFEFQKHHAEMTEESERFREKQAKKSPDSVVLKRPRKSGKKPAKKNQ
jgi:hypothetical protein